MNIRTTATGNGLSLINDGGSRPGTKSAVVTTHTEYNGKATYFTIKGNSQVTTSAGIVPWIYEASAGGVTIGW